jgi:Short-chain dehydrogenases of various substrate specificities
MTYPFREGGFSPVRQEHTVTDPAVIEPGMTALVTGASGGIGEQFARQLAGRGVHLVLAARSRERLERIAGELRAAHGVFVRVAAADLSVPAGVDEVVDIALAGGAHVDLLINNAGVAYQGQFVDQDPEAISRQLQLDCTSLVGFTRRLLPDMLSRGRGGVLNVASTAAFQPVPTMTTYAACKAFVLSFTEALWAETAHTGVRVMAVCPGPTETRFFETANPTTPFLTRGRQSPADVAEFALGKFERGHRPSVVPGVGNRLQATGYRFLPRSLVARVGERVLGAA